MALDHTRRQVVDHLRAHAEDHLHTIVSFARRLMGRAPHAPASGHSHHQEESRHAARRQIAHHVQQAAAAEARGEHHVAAHHMRTAGDHASRAGFHKAAEQARAHADTSHQRSLAQAHGTHGGQSAKQRAHAERVHAQSKAAPAQQRALKAGAKGGQYYVNEHGKKIYVKKK